MTHRVTPDSASPVWARMFTERWLPHWAMISVTGFYVANIVWFGVAGVPQTISVAWTGTLATWFGYCIRERSVTKGEK